MTEATAIRDHSFSETDTAISYQVAMPRPEDHLFEVTLQVQNWSVPVLDLKMPVWTPGSYLVREYAKQIQDFQARVSGSQQTLPSSKIGKNHWQIDTQSHAKMTISYRVFANELTVRTNHLDKSHGYFNGAALFFFIPGLETQSIYVTIIPPYDNWQVTTTLPLIPGESHTFVAKDFDTLVDSPFEIGYHRVYDFTVREKPHQLAIWGQGNANPEQIISDSQKIIEVEAELFGELPYQRYLFLLHLSASGFGGLEHKESCSLNYPRFGFRNRERYERFMQLVAHEFFHLWNVKRIRPRALEKFNYERENYTTSLWFCEGTTSYYDLLIPLWAGIYNRKTYLNNLSKEISRFLNTPGRKVQSLSESSFDAWIKLYRRDANSDNSQISYYLKGEMVSLLLDLLIRAKHKNQRSLNNVMRLMWERFGQKEKGFTPQQLREVISSVAEVDLTDFFDLYLDSTAELPFDDYFRPFGLELEADFPKEPVPHTGLVLDNVADKTVVKFVESASPAQVAGISSGDELLALNGYKVTAQDLQERLKDFQPGDVVELAVFHAEQLQSLPVKLGKPQPTRYLVKVSNSVSATQKELLAGWLGEE